MQTPIDSYWRIRLETLKTTLENNNYETFVVENGDAAKALVLEQILPKLECVTVAWGGSQTFVASGLYEALQADPDLEFMDTFDHSLPREELAERRRQALLADVFITGTNAVTENGQLVNLDMLGNRVGAITYGPHAVILLVGRNKVVADLDEAMFRIKNYAAPANAMRLDMKTPCVKTSYCEECQGPQRICNSWTITEKSFPKGRIKVVLINADMGL
jgi:hypothetical protein